METLKNINLKNNFKSEILRIYNKYRWLIEICLVFLVIFFYFKPEKVKVLKTERYVENTEKIKALELENQKLKFLIQKLSQDKIKVIIKKRVRWPDGKEEEILEEKEISRNEIVDLDIDLANLQIFSENLKKENYEKDMLKFEDIKNKNFNFIIGYNDKKDLEFSLIYNFKGIGFGLSGFYNIDSKDMFLGVKFKF